MCNFNSTHAVVLWHPRTALLFNMFLICDYELVSFRFGDASSVLMLGHCNFNVISKLLLLQTPTG